jgi:hypothetical protein
VFGVTRLVFGVGCWFVWRFELLDNCYFIIKLELKEHQTTNAKHCIAL